MKRFNKTINVEVEVDSIAEKLLSMFNKDEKHSEITTEAIIGNLVAKERISDLYNAMHGYTSKLNFQVGEVVITENLTCWCYPTEESRIKGSSESMKIDQATIVDIDEYADRQLKVSYFAPNKKGNEEERSEWVRVKNCSKIPV